MPSNFTENYQLCQWEASDQVRREDFNTDNAKIDAAIKGVDTRVDGLSASKADVSALTALTQTVNKKGNCQIIFGQYTGNGTVGQQNPNCLTFPKKPQVVMIFDYSTSVAVYGVKHMWIPTSSGNTPLYTTWSGNTLSWYLSEYNGSASYQLNESGKIYHYIALVEA